MIRILNNSNDPAFSLAAEEFLLTEKTDGEYLMLWRNVPSLIIGKFQNPYLELLPGKCERDGIRVLRRNSGGGTVYHDLGNLNYTVVTDKGTDSPEYERFLAPVIGFLSTLGITAEIRDTGALFSNGFKISGNAQSVSGNRIMHHGTLLFDSSLADINKYSGRMRNEITSKSIRSNPSDVGNIRPLLKADLDIDGFEEALGRYLSDGTYSFSQSENEKIAEIAANKYETWEWTYGKTPSFTLSSRGFTLTSRHGIIESASEYEDILSGKRLKTNEIYSLLLSGAGKAEAERITSIIFG